MENIIRLKIISLFATGFHLANEPWMIRLTKIDARDLLLAKNFITALQPSERNRYEVISSETYVILWIALMIRNL